MRAVVLSALLASGLALGATSPALSQAGIYIGPGGVGVDIGPPRYYRPPPRYVEPDYGISRGRAISIARRNGVDEIYDIDRRGPNWVVSGVSYRGRPITVWIDAYDGGIRIGR